MRSKILVFAILIPFLMTGFAAPSVAATANPQCTINGTNRADRITGTAEADVICAGGGNDTISGLGGNDIIFGGDGNDTIVGGAGDDQITGEAGTDSIDGAAGNDTISGGAGNDTLVGGTEVDMIRGDAGTDSINAGAGNDLIDGGAGKDQIRTGVGDDICSSDQTDSMLDACALDTTGPVFTSNSPTTPNFAAGSTLRISFVFSDTSGVANTWASIGGAPGWVTNWCGFAVEVPRISGDAKNGTYQFDCQVPANAVNGEYTLFLNAADMFGNSVSNYFVQIAFTVSGGSSDSAAPTVSNINLASTTKPAQNLTLTLDATDESGVAGIYGWFMLDGGGFAGYPDTGLYANATGEATLIQGTNKLGTYTQVFQFSSKAPAGTYTLWLSLRDDVGNRTFESTNVKVTLTK